jgi:transcriptional regulator NrdR family protein
MINLKTITGSGHVTTRRNCTRRFKSIEVSNAIDLIIEQSNKTEIVFDDDILQKSITTK